MIHGYATSETLLEVPGHRVRMTQVADSEALLADIEPVTFAEDERLPYWAELWPSAVALAHYVAKHLNLDGRHALEVGCGLGLVGVVAALQGARVLCTDYEEAALAFARRMPAATRAATPAAACASGWWIGAGPPCGGATTAFSPRT